MVLKTQSTTSRQNKNSSGIECLDECDIDDEGFIEGDLITGKVLSTFNFGMGEASCDNKTPAAEVLPENQTENAPVIQNETHTSTPRGLTPPVNGEHFTVKRSYAMRPSTVRKLNALKAEHPDVNILFNTIVDMAISHYYSYIFNQGGVFGYQEEKNKTS